MKKGDVIYVKKGKYIVGKGTILGGYKLEHRKRIMDSEGNLWQHQLPVDWEPFATPIEISLGSSPRPTVLRLTPDDVIRVERAIGRYSGAQITAPSSQQAGGGFGTYEENQIIERAAVQFVTKDFRRKGWSVTSVESEKCGFDLRCTKGSKIAEVEVKGVSGAIPAFIITDGEKRQAENNPRFVLCLVTGVGSRRPHLHRYSGSKFLRKFQLVPLQYRASPKV